MKFPRNNQPHSTIPKISPDDVKFMCETFMKEHVNDQLFIDNDLDFARQLYLLNHRDTYEGDFMDKLKQFVHNSSISDSQYEFVMKNFVKFTRRKSFINRYSPIFRR